LRLIRGSGGIKLSHDGGKLCVAHNDGTTDKLHIVYHYSPSQYLLVTFATSADASWSKNIPFLLARKEIVETPSVAGAVDIYASWVKYQTFTESWTVLTYPFERGRGARVPGVATML
jgi:hypothetical protein